MNSKAKYFYVMVTDWEDHWDKIDYTYYTKSIIRFDESEIQNDVPTLFVKIDKKSKKIQHIFKGSISEIKKEGGKVHFKVNRERELLLSEVPPNIPVESGWYRYEGDLEEPEDLYPPFFRNLRTTDNWEEFENKVYWLLKLIGITTIIKYPRKKQAGLPDGIFKIKNLVVIYDATLSDTENKKEQILNYVNRLKSDRLEVSDKENWDIRNYSRQVWLITRKENTRKDKVEENVQVKIVSIDSLLKLYKKRLIEIEKEEDLAELVKKIETL
ncbi:MAG: hypothetical protein ABIK84_02775 [candidate division WOR-3 bacterium]